MKIKTKLLNPITFLSFKSSFSYIIGTNDGSPIHDFINKFTAKNVPSKILLNGVNDLSPLGTSRKSFNIPENLPVLLFNGRHSEDKGILEFINTIFALIKKGEEIYTIILGNGKFYKQILTMIHRKKVENILVTGAIPNSKVYSYYKLCDIYISLNKLGNLSNTVLEAINAEKCIITLAQEKFSTRDEQTKKILGDSAIYINRENLDDELERSIKTVLDDRDIIKEKKIKIKKIKEKLRSWEERVNDEIEIISTI